MARVRSSAAITMSGTTARLTVNTATTPVQYLSRRDRNRSRVSTTRIPATTVSSGATASQSIV